LTWSTTTKTPAVSKKLTAIPQARTCGERTGWSTNLSKKKMLMLVEQRTYPKVPKGEFRWMLITAIGSVTQKGKSRGRLRTGTVFIAPG